MDADSLHDILEIIYGAIRAKFLNKWYNIDDDIDQFDSDAKAWVAQSPGTRTTLGFLTLPLAFEVTKARKAQLQKLKTVISDDAVFLAMQLLVCRHFAQDPQMRADARRAISMRLATFNYVAKRDGVDIVREHPPVNELPDLHVVFQMNAMPTQMRANSHKRLITSWLAEQLHGTMSDPPVESESGGKNATGWYYYDFAKDMGVAKGITQEEVNAGNMRSIRQLRQQGVDVLDSPDLLKFVFVVCDSFVWRSFLAIAPKVASIINVFRVTREERIGGVNPNTYEAPPDPSKAKSILEIERPTKRPDVAPPPVISSTVAENEIEQKMIGFAEKARANLLEGLRARTVGKEKDKMKKILIAAGVEKTATSDKNVFSLNTGILRKKANKSSDFIIGNVDASILNITSADNGFTVDDPNAPGGRRAIVQVGIDAKGKIAGKGYVIPWDEGSRSQNNNQLAEFIYTRVMQQTFDAYVREHWPDLADAAGSDQSDVIVSGTVQAVSLEDRIALITKEMASSEEIDERPVTSFQKISSVTTDAGFSPDTIASLPRLQTQMGFGTTLPVINVPGQADHGRLLGMDIYGSSLAQQERAQQALRAFDPTSDTVVSKIREQFDVVPAKLPTTDQPFQLFAVNEGGALETDVEIRGPVATN